MNSEIESNRKVEEGNTQITSSTPLMKQAPQRIHHFFTLNNYNSCDIYILEKLFNEYCYMYAFQEETGENGTPHLQGIISCKKATRDTVFGNKKIHWEKPRNVKESYAYCTKTETRTGDVYTLNYELPFEMKLDLFDWQKNIVEKIKVKPDDRSVIWVWSSSGNTGKSTFCKYLVVNFKAVFLSKGKYSDIINIIHKTDMMKSNLVVIDLPRNNGNKVSYDAIESIKNGMICNTKFETGSKLFNPPHIIVFSNDEPEYDKLSEDRWCVINVDDEVVDNRMNDAELIDNGLDKGVTLFF